MYHYQFVSEDGCFRLPPSFTLYKCVILIDREVTPAFREEVSRALVATGCRYALAWGRECSLWDDSIDLADLERFDFGHIPDDQFVMTTWHANEPIHEPFVHAKLCAKLSYDDRALTDLLVLDIGPEERAEEVRAIYDWVEAGGGLDD
ncbi:MAG: hypothetical protein RID23_08615 [Roseovarius sp.]